MAGNSTLFLPQILLKQVRVINFKSKFLQFYLIKKNAKHCWGVEGKYEKRVPDRRGQKMWYISLDGPSLRSLSFWLKQPKNFDPYSMSRTPLFSTSTFFTLLLENLFLKTLILNKEIHDIITTYSKKPLNKQRKNCNIPQSL